jgi:uncharacterized protein
MKKIILVQDCVSGVPLIFCAPEEAEKLPLVFYIHGFAGDKRGGLELAYNLAERGIATISLDAAMHGGRLDYRVATTWNGPQKGDIFPYETGLDRYLLIMKVIEETVKDLKSLVEHYQNDPRVDTSRLGLCGTSMGGFIAYCFAAGDPSVKALAAMISFPTLLQRWQDVLLEASLQPDLAETMQAVAAEAETRGKEVAAIDPTQGLRSFAPKPLLIVCGDLDTDTHKSYSLRFYEEMIPLYKDQAGNLQYRVHPNAIHRVTSAMVNDAVDWFARHL